MLRLAASQLKKLSGFDWTQSKVVDASIKGSQCQTGRTQLSVATSIYSKMNKTSVKVLILLLNIKIDKKEFFKKVLYFMF